MKKIFTLLWLTLAAFTFKATAQTTPNCNAEFGVQYLTNFTVKFNPVIANDSPFVRHFWRDISLNGLAKYKGRSLDKIFAYMDCLRNAATLIGTVAGGVAQVLSVWLS